MRQLVGILTILYCTFLPVVVIGVQAAPGSSEGRNGHARCHLETWNYVPSKLELLWKKNLQQWQKPEEYCRATESLKSNISYWLETNADLMVSTRTHLWESKGVFSSFVRKYNCSGSVMTHTSWIEPLSFCLRHPAAPCDGDKVMERDYLVLASRADAAWHPHMHSHPRAFYFDLGASTWSSGAGGASQSFLVDTYKRRGIKFDRILLWEAEKVDVAGMLEQLPKELHAVYQYMNIPAVADRHDPANPLNIIKQITNPGDFVVLKLDTDHPMLEDELILQLLEEPEVWHRIDEFFFEHHVNFAPMVAYWNDGIDKRKTLADSYELFGELRRRGIRAHGWP